MERAKAAELAQTEAGDDGATADGRMRTVVVLFILLWVGAAIVAARLHWRRGGSWVAGLILGLILGPLEYMRMSFTDMARWVDLKRRREHRSPKR